MTRRRLLEGALAALGGPSVLGCSESDGAPGPKDAGGPGPIGGGTGGPILSEAGAVDCADRFAGGELLGSVAFVNEDHGPLDTATGSGLNGRLYTDLSGLTPQTLITPNDAYYIRTRYPDLIDPNAAWKIAVSGLVKTPLDLTLDMLAPKVHPASFGPFVMECSGNGSFASFGMLSSARWSGIPIKDVLAFVEVLPQATRVRISGFDKYAQPQPGNSTPGASWIFTLDQLEAAGAFLATQMNGVPLPNDHGSPIRLIVPNWYGCTCIKWVNEIVLVDDSALPTDQMKEYAARTHQVGTPAFARDFKPATIDQAAMPIRVERWRLGGKILHRVVGIMWGGYQVTSALAIRFGASEPFVPVNVCPAQSANQPWTLWTHAWAPAAAGRYDIRLAVTDRSIPTRRLDLGFYQRSVDVSELR